MAFQNFGGGADGVGNVPVIQPTGIPSASNDSFAQLMSLLRSHGVIPPNGATAPPPAIPQAPTSPMINPMMGGQLSQAPFWMRANGMRPQSAFPINPVMPYGPNMAPNQFAAPGFLSQFASPNPYLMPRSQAAPFMPPPPVVSPPDSMPPPSNGNGNPLGDIGGLIGWDGPGGH